MAITFDDIKKMPFKYKVLIIVGIFVLVGYFYYFYFYSAAYAHKARLQEQVENLQRQIVAKERVALRIEQYRKEIKKLNKDLEAAMAQLPEQKEIPGLLTSVSHEGLKKGLDFILFEPTSPVPRDFYADIPVKIIVLGTYHDIARFFEGVASLPRIMNVKNISMKRSAQGGGSVTRLETSCIIKTYMFLEKQDAGKAKP